jgi:hypothetical protein
MRDYVVAVSHHASAAAVDETLPGLTSDDSASNNFNVIFVAKYFC